MRPDTDDHCTGYAPASARNFSHEKYSSDDPDHFAKLCFVTVGATAPFSSLVREVLSVLYLSLPLYKWDYTHLLVQFGSLGYHVFEKFKSANGLHIKKQFGVMLKDLTPTWTV